MRNIEFECARKLVTKFIESPKNWPQEIKIAKKLLRDFSPDLDSWLELNLPHKIPSLAFFLTEGGKIYIPNSGRNPYLLDLDKLCSKNNKKLDFLVEN